MRYEDACALLEGVVERAKMDAEGFSSNWGIPHTCPATEQPHRAMVCARDFLSKIDEFLRENPEPSGSDIVQAILEVIE
jgi:hypothetical protein